MLNAEPTVCVAAASLKRWELSDVGGKESLQPLIKCSSLITQLVFSSCM